MLRPVENKLKTRRAISPVVLADELLVVRCLRNERAAWIELFDLCHGRIMKRVGSVLRRSPGAMDTAEEVAAQVWMSVLLDDGRLLRRFDAENGARIATYLSGIASKETLKYLRAARRRKHREAEYGKTAARNVIPTPAALLDLKEFLSLLSPAEQQVCLNGLQIASESASAVRRRATSDVRKGVRGKLSRFLEEERGAR